MNIELQIEELLLHGFARKDQVRIQRAIEQELTRLLTEQGVPASLSRSQEIQQLQGGSFNVRAGMGVETIGSQVAQAIYGGIGE
ncbi:hypothetical protein [Nostoc parmelioides]|uniref:Uncharacterized protein n=1 Tax=Nostoc parmelioides FACHB-3921 TaxID=2692909 RepID=A0ABR8BIN8_9NOSO|nr:hypothetical protein [Nostoc parmelioides]MBD2253365.1 hypothetical protein [Nostoc parmelioides FACHB-3921]